MPVVGGEVICREWRHEHHTADITRDMAAGYLYVYSYASSAPPVQLAPFEALR
jgi:hypothetical protein